MTSFLWTCFLILRYGWFSHFHSQPFCFFCFFFCCEQQIIIFLGHAIYSKRKILPRIGLASVTIKNSMSNYTTEDPSNSNCTHYLNGSFLHTFGKKRAEWKGSRGSRRCRIGLLANTITAGVCVTVNICKYAVQLKMAKRDDSSQAGMGNGLNSQIQQGLMAFESVYK